MRNSSAACVDANLVVRVLGPSPSSEILEQWRRWRIERTSLIAPRLLRYEVVNALYQLIKQGQINKAVAVAAIRAMNEMPITLYHDEVLHQRALDHAVQFNLGATYDAHYLALAEHIGCELWTADKRLFNSVNHRFPWIRFIAD